MPGARKAPPNTYWRGETLWGRLQINGIEYRASLRTADVKKARTELEQWRKRLEAERAAESAGRFPYKAAVVRWLEQHLPRIVKPAVVERYHVSARAFGPFFEELYLDQIDQAAIVRFMEQRQLTVSNATLRRDLTALSQLCTAARSWGWMRHDPLAMIDLDQVRERRDPIILPEEDDVQRVLAAAPPLMAAVLRLLDQTGMRETEAAWLQRSAIDWQDHTITLLHTKTGRPRAIHWRTPGGDAGPILMAQEVREGCPYVFPLPAGDEPYQNFSSNFGRVIRAVEAECEKKGIPFRRWRVHDLRHRFAVRALKQGMSIYELQQHLGHRSITTTEIYLEYLPAQAQTVARRGSAQNPAHRVVSAQEDGEK